MATDLIRSIRSESIRVRRMWKLPAVALLITIVATAVSYGGTSVGGPTGSSEGTTAATRSVDALAAPDGIMTGVAAAGTLIALLCLVMWALSVARDLQTGSIRILLVTQPRRVVYLGGKLVALAAVTVTTAMVAVAASVGVAYIAAPAQGVSTSGWAWSYVASMIVNLSLTTLLWGALGAMLAMLSRSPAAAIATGVGYLLLGERLIGLVWSTAEAWLPSGVSTDVIEGGSATTPYTTSVLLALAYLTVAGATTITTLRMRDVTD